MPHDPDPPPAKRFKPGSVFFRLDKNKPGMLLPRKGNASTPIDVQRKQLPIYQAKPQLLSQLRQLHGAVLIGESQLQLAAATHVNNTVVHLKLCLCCVGVVGLWVELPT